MFLTRTATASNGGSSNPLQTTIWEGGTVVVPAFAIGRTQEMMLVCAAHDVECYVDGMGNESHRTPPAPPDFLRDADALQRATSHARFVDGRDGQRRRIAEAEHGHHHDVWHALGRAGDDLHSGDLEHPVNKIALTGYQVEGTPGGTC